MNRYDYNTILVLCAVALVLGVFHSTGSDAAWLGLVVLGFFEFAPKRAPAAHRIEPSAVQAERERKRGPAFGKPPPPPTPPPPRYR